MSFIANNIMLPVKAYLQLLKITIHNNVTYYITFLSVNLMLLRFETYHF